MAKVAKPLNLKEFRNLLVSNCDALIERYTTIIVGLQYSDASAQAYQKYYGVTKVSGRTTTTSPSRLCNTDVKTESGLLVPTHAGLIQEWLIFLDSIFGRIVLYYLETNVPDKLPAASVKLKKVNPTNLVEMRKSISEAAKEFFSFQKYGNKIKTLRDIFGIKISKLDNQTRPVVETLNDEMKKHIAIRNVFQHHRGNIRDSDLAEIGLQYFELLDENKTKTKYHKGDDIILSITEIENLNQVIKDYSKKFEVLS